LDQIRSSVKPVRDEFSTRSRRRLESYFLQVSSPTGMGHEWRASFRDRTVGAKACPICA
jgi:hypothetical protein